MVNVALRPLWLVIVGTKTSIESMPLCLCTEVLLH